MMSPTLPEPAQRLWTDHGDMLVQHLEELDGGPASWQLGGGTILGKHWKHRQSFDLDITVSERAPRIQAWDTVVSIGRELERRGLDVDYDAQNLLMRANAGAVNEYGDQSGIDVWLHDPGLPAPPQSEEIETCRIPTLSIPQILHGKLQRDRQALTRDAYDIAHARGADSTALEIAINSLDADHQRRSEITWAAAAGTMNMEPHAILGWDGKPARDQHDCGIRAAHAIHDTRWKELDITTRNGHVFARTVNVAGEERHWLGTAGTHGEEATQRLNQLGIVLHMQNQYRTADWKVQDVVDEIAKSTKAGKKERILHARMAAGESGAQPQALFTGEIPPEGPRVRAGQATQGAAR